MASEHNEYYPFANQKEFGKALWLHKTELTGGDLNNFFRDDATSDWRERLSFKSAKESVSAWSLTH